MGDASWEGYECPLMALGLAHRAASVALARAHCSTRMDRIAPNLWFSAR